MNKALEYAHWEDARQFNQGQGFLSPLQERAVRKCTIIPVKMPTEREVQHALEALEILRQEGFQY